MRKKERIKLNIRFAETIISVIIITSNDEDIIEERINLINQELKKLKANYEILIVDNGSRDKTLEKIKQITYKVPYIRALILSRRYDTEIALTAGLDSCIGDYVKLFNIYTDPPEILPKLLDKLIEGHDIVIGKPKQEIIKRSPISKIFLSLVNRLSHGFAHSDSFLIALNRRAINSITRTRRKSRHFGYLATLVGFKKTVVPYKPIKKFRHKLRNESFLEILLSTIDILISNSARPMRILSFLGLLGSFLFLLYVAGITILDVFFGFDLAPKGWITIAGVLGAMFLLLFSLLALISEYVIRIVQESRNEPFYFIAEEIDKSVILPKYKKRLNIV